MPKAQDLKYQYTNMRGGKLFNIGVLVLPTMTTTERDLLKAEEGMIILNTTLNKVQAYVNGSWTSLH
jgi:hypothetical protein